MQELIDLYKKSKNLHHAYFLVGEKENILNDLKDFLQTKLGIKTSSNPDFYSGKFSTLTITEARYITGFSERKDFSGGKKFFIIEADFITEEAQNALLKVFEEPTSGTHFFIISPQDILLPTLRSRMQIIQVESSKIKTTESFLSLKLKDRLNKVKEITEGIKDEEKTKQDAITLLNEIEKELYNKGPEKFVSSLKICQSARDSLYDRGAPIKIILENVMLSI